MDSPRKKRVLIHSNFCKAFTGFGKHKKNILRYLFRTNKYEIFELANGLPKFSPETSKTPWKTYGSLPDERTLASIKDDQNQVRLASYGVFTIDDIIKDVKPDVYIGIEDIWAFDGFFDKPWWNKINSMIWTTLDSLPILDSAIDAAPKVKNYYVWSSFAERFFKQMGYDHIKTLRGSLDCSKFFRMDDHRRANLRKKFGLKDEFIIGFVFRNQLRKSVPNLLEGFKIFKNQAPNAKLLLHTHWSEGWDIPKLIREKGLNNSDILTTYFCNKCKTCLVHPYVGQENNCPACKGQKTMNTTNIANGVSDEQLNSIYNLMDVYCHPFTSGGQEIPIQEAKLTELITLVTNYSCGEDYCTPESGGLELNWSEYREPGTQFIKASTDPNHIAEQLMKVYEMPSIERAALGIQARKFVVEQCSVESIGKQLEEIIDAMPEVDYDFDNPPQKFNPDFQADESLTDKEFIITLHREMLGEIIDANHTSFKHWLNKLKGGLSRKDMHLHFRNTCIQKTSKPPDFECFLDADDNGRRIGVLIPETATDVLLINGLLTNLKIQYPDHNIYVITHPHYFEYIEDNPSTHKCIAYSSALENLFILEGASSHRGYFDLAFMPTIATQKIITYIHNGKDKTQFDLI
jgi:glycosyltransferase involved in cell wall biosynthesis